MTKHRTPEAKMRFTKGKRQSMHALLMMADVTDVNAVPATERSYTHEAARAAAILGQQVHCGVFAQPYRFEGMIRVSAVRGCSAARHCWSRRWPTEPPPWRALGRTSTGLKKPLGRRHPLEAAKSTLTTSAAPGFTTLNRA